MTPLRTLLLAVVTWLLVAAGSPASAQFTITGRVATRGLVLRNVDGSFGGAGARKTWVEYDDSGRKFPLGRPDVQQRPGTVVLSVEDYCARLPNPDECKAPLSGMHSVLVDDASPPVRLYASPRLIAYETDFMTIDPRENTSGSISANCLLDESQIPLGNNVNIDVARARTFVTCKPKNMGVPGSCPSGTCTQLRVWAPIVNATIEMVNLTVYKSTKTDEGGFFALPYRGRTNEQASFDLNGVIAFGGFEPRTRSAQFFYVTASAVSGYNYDPGQAYMGSVPIPIISTDPAGSLGTQFANIPLEAAILTLQARMKNPVDGGLGSIALTQAPASTQYDPGHAAQHIGLLRNIGIPELRDSEVYVYRVADGKLVGSRWGMSATEVAAADVDLNNNGTIDLGERATADCQGQACLVTSMLIRGPASLYLGHSPARFNPAANSPPLMSNGKILSPGKFGIELDYAHGLSTGMPPFLHEGDQAKVIVINRATGYMGSKLVEMRRGDNGPMTFVPVGAPSGIAPITIDLLPPNLRVTVTRQTEVTRGATQSAEAKQYVIGFEGSALDTDKVIEIQTEWLDQDNKPLPEDLPGFTGRLAFTVPATGPGGDAVQLPDGGWVQLHSEGQQTQSDKPNPDDADDRTGFFPVRPGKANVVIRLPRETLEKGHFYVHLDAQPLTRNIDFTGRPPAAGPSFSVNQVCYSTCIDGNQDLCAAGQTGTATWSCFSRPDGVSAADLGALSQRPITYVPFLTPKYRGKDTEGNAVYDYVYRPEMQFSVFTLAVQELNLTNTDGTQRNVLAVDEVSSLYSSDSMLRALYNLEKPSTSALADVDGDPRKLVFQLGDKFADITFSDNQDPEHPDDHSAQLQTPRLVPKGITAQDFLTLRLVQRKDEGNVLWQYGFQDIWIYFTEQKDGAKITQLPRGEYSQANALLEPANPTLLRDVRWNVIRKHTQKDVKIEIDPTTGVIWVPEDSAEGPAVIEARINDNLFTRVQVPVGCDCKTCKTPGQCILRVGSVDLTFSLGTTEDGLSPGQLWLQTDTLNADAYSRKSLQLSILDRGAVEGLRDSGGLRQVVAPGTFVDVEDLDGGYAVHFYQPNVKGALNPNTHRYDLNPPGTDGELATWTISNPGDGQNATKRLRVSERRGGTTKDHDYEQDPATGQWSLIEGAGLRREQRLEQPRDGDRVVRISIAGPNGTASVVEQTYHPFDWGEELIREVRDTDHPELATTTAYYENPDDVGSHRQVFYRIEPDGSWVRYAYDDHRRMISETRPWLDGPAHPLTALDSDARVTQYSYAPVDPQDVAASNSNPEDYGFHRARTTTERIQGNLASLTYRSLRNTSDGGHLEIEERCPKPSSSFGDSSCLRTETRYYGGDPDSVAAGKVRSSQQPDGRLDSYQYEFGSLNGNAFSPGEGRAIRTTVTHGTVSSPSGIADKTTQEVSIVDALGHAVRDETYVHTGQGYALIQWTQRQYDAEGHLTLTTRSNGEQERATWGCCAENTTTDSRGIVTTYERDELQRVQASLRTDIRTTFDYDAQGRVVRTTRSGGGRSLTSTTHYDSAGRIDSSTDEAGLITRYAYAQAGRITTTTRPGGFTEVAEHYLDGQQKSLTGSAVIAQHYSYSIQGDGTRITQVRTARSDSPAFERTITDMLGRTVRIERPGFNGTLEVETHSYDNQSHLQRTTTPALAPALYEYDELGDPLRSGLDVDQNGSLDLAGNDRITEQQTRFISLENQYWQQASQAVYAAAGSSTPTVTSTTRNRLTGLRQALLNEQVSIDIYGNQTRSIVTINPATRTETRITDVPDSTQDAITITTDGRLTSSTSTTGLTTTYGYDGLGRHDKVTAPRTGTTETHYDDQGRVDFVQDPAGHKTTFGYDPATGRKSRETNALGKNSFFAYDPRGQLIQTWGDVPYPVEYLYNEYGRRTEMHTFRTDAGWTSPTWPSSASGDVTRWHYEEATGLLLSKEDAASKSVVYSYGPARQPATRTWARQKAGGGPLRTTYAYDSATAELRLVDYNDATPDVTYTYDRIGRQSAVADGVGTRTFGYDPNTLQLQTERIEGLTPALLTHYRDAAYVKGRLTGIGLDDNYTVGYEYDASGRLKDLDWMIAGSTDVATYARTSNGDLLAGYTTSSGFSATYAYEPSRDLKTQVRNSFGSNVISQYDYGYDTRGRRSSVESSGSVFSATAFTKWGYDERNQVTSSNRYTGAVVATPSPADEVASERREYDYDPIGNRESALAQTGVTSVSYSANELNQYESVGSEDPTYDEDGNLLSDGTKVLEYNVENQLKSIMVPGVSVSTYDYDYMGRRVRKRVDSLDGSGNDYVVTWVYSGWSKLEERKTISSVTTTKNFVWGLDLSQSMDGAGGIAGLLAVVVDGENATLFAYDGNGNVSELIASSDGSVAAHYEYDAFGNSVLSSGALAKDNCFRFSTKDTDDETGLYYYGYRYYDPRTGRWSNADPLGELVGANPFLFVWNAPADHADFLGLDGFRDQVDELLDRVNEAMDAPLDAAAAKMVAGVTSAAVRFAQANRFAVQAQTQERFKWELPQLWRAKTELVFGGAFKLRGNASDCSTKVSFAIFGSGKIQLPLAPNPLVPDVLFELAASAQGDLIYRWNHGIGSDSADDYGINGDLKVTGIFGLRWEKDLSIKNYLFAKAFGEVSAGKTWAWNMATLERKGTTWGGAARFATEYGAKVGRTSEVTRNEIRISIGGDLGTF